MRSCSQCSRRTRRRRSSMEDVYSSMRSTIALSFTCARPSKQARLSRATHSSGSTLDTPSSRYHTCTHSACFFSLTFLISAYLPQIENYTQAELHLRHCLKVDPNFPMKHVVYLYLGIVNKYNLQYKIAIEVKRSRGRREETLLICLHSSCFTSLLWHLVLPPDTVRYTQLDARDGIESSHQHWTVP